MRRSFGRLICPIASSARLNVSPTWGAGAFTGDDAPTLDSFCRAYAYIATQQTAGAFACGFDTTKGRFDVNFEHHRLACMGCGNQSARNAGQIAANEITGRTRDKVACANRSANSPPPPPPPWLQFYWIVMSTPTTTLKLVRSVVNNQTR